MSAALNFIGILTISISIFVATFSLTFKALAWMADFLEETFELKKIFSAVLAMVIIFGGFGVACLIAARVVSV